MGSLPPRDRMNTTRRPSGETVIVRGSPRVSRRVRACCRGNVSSDGAPSGPVPGAASAGGVEAAAPVAAPSPSPPSGLEGGRVRDEALATHGCTRILAWASGWPRSAKACGTPSTVTDPVIIGSRSTLPSAIAIRAAANSWGS